MRDRRGMTLIEMLIAITVFTVILGERAGFPLQAVQGTGPKFGGHGHAPEPDLRRRPPPGGDPHGRGQRAFQATCRASTRAPTPSSSAPTTPPMSTACTPCTTTRGCPTGQVNALTSAQRFALPGTSPAFMLPRLQLLRDGRHRDQQPGGDDHLVLPAGYLDRDAGQRLPPPPADQQPAARGRDPERHSRPPAGTSSATTTSGSRLPAPRSPRWTRCRPPGCRCATPRASMACRRTSAGAARVDSLATVEVAFTVSNGLTGAELPHPGDLLHRADAERRDQEGHQLRRPAALRLGLNAEWTIDNAVTPPDTIMRAHLEPGD